MAKVISDNIFGNNTNVHQGDNIINISSYSGTGQLNLEYLPASFNDANKQHLSMCLPHTREQMLRDIRTWIDGNSEKGIYWLNGMAGTGKTTISLTIAHEYHQKKRLGASFFFSRGGGDLASAKKFAPTVAVQLAEKSPELRRLISNATRLNPRIGHLNLYNQWEKLVLEPLGLLESSSVQQPLLIVVDALDEPELPIHLTLSRVSINLHHHFTLHSIEQAIVDGDLRIYYQHHLSQLSERYMWNQHIILEDVIRSLVEKTHGLFIYAATAYRSSASEAEKELDNIYTTVLESSFRTELSSTEARELQPEFQKIVGSVMVLFDTLALDDLVGIINGQKDRVESMLNNLRSVLDISEDDRRQIRILHPSFRDFLLNPERCFHKTFRISAKQLHYEWFERCLAIMHGSLPKDICKLRNPASKARDITKDQVDKCISFPIQYACRYWIQHLQRSRLSDGINLLAGLESWLHDTSKKKNFQTGAQSQWNMMGWFTKNIANHAGDTSISQSLGMLIHDAKRFASQHSGIIEETPLQIYCSALIFSPEQSLIRQRYHAEIPSWIIPSFRRHSTWPRYTQALWHTQPARSLAFSPDGSYLAAGCEDGAIWLWDAVTGAKQRILKQHGESVNSICFSPKEELIASGSADDIWKVAFSPDGTSLAALSGRGSRTVRMWDIASHTKQWTWRGDHDADISFLSDGAHIAYSSYSVTGLLDSKTGKSVCILTDRGGIVCSSKLQSGNQMVGLRISCDIELFDIQPTVRRRWHSRLGFNLDARLTFSPDDRILAANYGHDIELLDTASGHKTHTISCDTYMTRFAFSADGSFIASTSMANIIKFWDLFVALVPKDPGLIRGLFETQVLIWDTQEMRMKHKVVDLFEWESGENVLTATGSNYHPRIDTLKDSPFSPDDSLLALYTENRFTIDIHIWDIRRRTVTRKIEGSNHWVAFSQDSKRIAYLISTSRIAMFDLKTWERLASIEVDREKTRFCCFDKDDRLVLFYAAKSKGPVQMQITGYHTETVSRIIQLDHVPSHIHSFKPVPAANVVIVQVADRCEIWDLATGLMMGSFTNIGGLAYSQLLPCKAHLRIDGVIVPVSKPEPLSCCSHRLSLDGLWIKRGNEKLVYIPPDYASALIAVGCKGASFLPFKKRNWNIFRSNSKLINTLEFDFSRNQSYI
ncbi:hypothetical protein T069G_06084 [Trichoderma breve]|uniref:Nephrocystin 3-like N-terminal domain-containing protein n=1 Tax=Trichoderma breve TaxID=2034170 RepID=A0A9W9EA08_9HYPO|nr:hypothetical protein T069G_06084 [Trichoderma breve]KAJ4861096.1 hypothetical protein T069G_06084 [Trichoderma breve]